MSEIFILSQYMNMINNEEFINMNKNKIAAIIPARGNSKRLGRKNIHEIWGKPMLYWAIKACLDSKHNIEPWVSTEDPEIKKIALELGARVHDRDPKLSEDHIYKQVVIRSAAEHIKKVSNPDIWISLQANSPQIKPEHLNSAIDSFLEHNLNRPLDELFSVDKNLMQNAAFRIFKGDYVFQKDLSTNCDVYIRELHDVHTIEDVKLIEESEK